MILQALNELYDRLKEDPSYGIAPVGFSPQKISFCLVLNSDGSLFDIDSKGDGAKPARLEVPTHEKRTSGIKPQLLCDKKEYLLGLGRWECFEKFRDYHLSLQSVIDSPDYNIFCLFLKNWKESDLEKFSENINKCGANFGVIQIRGKKEYLHEDPIIRNWVLGKNDFNENETSKQQCLVSGKPSDICRIHPDIKGFKSSTALVGIQEKTSFESYGLSKTENCPIGEEVAYRYAAALNSLLDGPQKQKHRCTIGSTTAIFWTEKKSTVEDFLSQYFHGKIEDDTQNYSKRESVKRLLEAIRSGGKFSDFGDLNDGFFILGIEQPNPGRFAIRFFHRSTVEELLSRLHNHQKNFSIARDPGQSEIPMIWQILDETAPRHRDASGKYGKPDRDKIPPLLGGALTRAIIEGTPYPEGLFAAIIGRIRADRIINYLRAATLKAILTRNHHQSISTMLDPENHDPAYLLGRLFAALEKTQEDALGSVNAGLRDRFYGSASATPAAVFPRLMRTYQHHLSALNGGSKTNRDKLVQEIVSGIPSGGFPRQFGLREQGIFAIGYYHQRKDFFTKKEQVPTNETSVA
jgi:CRISPR-associated protein Csd1